MTTTQSRRAVLPPTTGRTLRHYTTGLKLRTVMKVYSLPYRTLLGHVLELLLTTEQVTTTLSLLDTVICMHEEIMIRQLLAEPPGQRLLPAGHGVIVLDPRRLPDGAGDVAQAVAYALSEYLRIWLDGTRQFDTFETHHATITADAATLSADVVDLIIQAETTDGIPRVLWQPGHMSLLTGPLTDGCIRILAARARCPGSIRPIPAQVEEAVQATVSDALRRHWPVTT